MHSTERLSEQEKHLVGLAVTMTRGCQICTRNRVEKARSDFRWTPLAYELLGVVGYEASCPNGRRLGKSEHLDVRCRLVRRDKSAHFAGGNDLPNAVAESMTRALV